VPAKVSKVSWKMGIFAGTFKTSREDRLLRLKIQIVRRTLGVSPETRNFNGAIESTGRKKKLAVEDFKRPREIRTHRRKTKSSAED
jgi:hypothetical protein